jgi:nucleotide-binding universal stress UspA family protein
MDPLLEATMTPATIAPQVEGAVANTKAIRRGPIIVATDGTTACDAAFHAADRLSALHNAKVTVLSVVEPVVVVPMDVGMTFPYAEIEQAQVTARATKVRAQLERVGARDAGWSVSIEYGEPAYEIATAAHDLDATMVVTGLGHHDLLDRVLGGETSLRILRACKSPLLAVTRRFESLPRRVVVATDFSVASLDSARTALRLFPSITTLHLVHVMSPLEVPPDEFVTWAGLYSEPIPDSFERLVNSLELPSSISIETDTLEGKPSREVLHFARKAAADLIVTGSRGAGLMNRLLVGSTATGIIRGANCAVLAVPAAPGSDRMVGVEEFTAGSGAEARWAEELSAFTARNAGRHTSLEVDDPDHGLLLQEHGYPLLGVTYDHNDKRVEIMLGDPKGTRRHLTRGISNVISVDVLRDARGRDQVLRVAHGRGQTLLTLEI